MQKVVDPHLLTYNDTWDKVDAMLVEALSEGFRARVRDSEGAGWVYNWFCVDHVDYDVNPRWRDMGYHNIFDHYRSAIRETNSRLDGLHFHFHPHSFRRRKLIAAPPTGGPTPAVFSRSSAAGDRTQMVSGGSSGGVPRDPARQSLVPRAIRPF